MLQPSQTRPPLPNLRPALQTSKQHLQLASDQNRLATLGSRKRYSRPSKKMPGSRAPSPVLATSSIADAAVYSEPIP